MVIDVSRVDILGRALQVGLRLGPSSPSLPVIKQLVLCCTHSEGNSLSLGVYICMCVCEGVGRVGMQSVYECVYVSRRGGRQTTRPENNRTNEVQARTQGRCA